MEPTTTRYLSEFKVLEKMMRQAAGGVKDIVRFEDILQRAKQRNPAIEYYEGKIRDLYALRNVFAHSDREKYIAEVNESAYKQIQTLVSLLKEPPTVIPLFQKEVYCAYLDDDARTILIQREFPVRKDGGES